MIHAETTAQLILTLFEAVQNAAHWQMFLEGFTGALGSDQGSLMVWNLEFQHNSVACYTGASEEDRREYLERWVGEDPWMTRLHGEAPEGLFIPSHEITPDEALETTEVYQKYLKPRNWHYGGGVMALRSPVLFSTLSTLRSKHKGPITEEERAWVQQLVPYLQMAARLHEQFSRLKTEHDASQAHLDLLPHGLAMVGPEGYLLVANRQMRAMLDASDGLGQQEHRLKVWAAEGREVEQWLKLAQAGRAIPRRLAVRRPSGRRPYWVTVTPVAAANGVPLGSLQPIATVTAIDPESRTAPDPAAMAAMFGMTPAECRLAELLASGLTLQEAALQLFISLHTAKTHLKRILSKTGTRRQADLVSLLLSIGSPGN